jgi:O-antigen/teichoic acid export membrane protein
VLLLRSVQTHFQVEGKFNAYGKLELLHFFAKFTGIAICIASGHANPGMILAFYAVAPLGIVTLFFAFSGKRFFYGREMISVPLLMELLRFVKWFLIVNGISVVIVYLPNLLITRLANLREVGIYSAGQTLASVFPLLGAYLAILLSPRIMTYCRQGRYYSLFLTAQKLLSAGAVSIFLFFFFYFDFISRKLLPSHYAGSKAVFMVLLPSALCWLVAMPLNVNFLLFVRPKFIVIMEGAIFPLLLVSYYWFVPAHGALGAAWVTTIFGMIRSGIIQLAAWMWARKMPVTADDGLIVFGDSMLALDPSKRTD